MESKKYLNIYVCDLSNALGFASFPGTIESRDAVVINYNNFGTINLLHHLTKEELQHMNLVIGLIYYIFGEMVIVEMTKYKTLPFKYNENYGCPSHPSPSCSNNGDMFQNFMDYTNDACMNLFTKDKKIECTQH